MENLNELFAIALFNAENETDFKTIQEVIDYEEEETVISPESWIHNTLGHYFETPETYKELAEEGMAVDREYVIDSAFPDSNQFLNGINEKWETDHSNYEAYLPAFDLTGYREAEEVAEEPVEIWDYMDEDIIEKIHDQKFKELENEAIKEMNEFLKK